jgi:uridine kinase
MTLKSSTIIGISGGSGSGKTSFIKAIREQYSNEDVCIISQDDYYRPREEQIYDENGVQNFDLPSSIDLDAFLIDLNKVVSGEIVTRLEYVFNNKDAEASYITFKPAPVIIVEGLFIFQDVEINKLIDYSIIINAKPSDKIIRRILRDQKERNYPIEDVLYRYKHHVMPAFEKYIEPFLDEVDIIINNNESYEKGAKLIKFMIQSLLADAKLKNG